MPDTFKPDAAVKRLHNAPRPEPSGARFFADDRGPIGHVGRRSIPKSHRAEGENFVD